MYKWNIDGNYFEPYTPLHQTEEMPVLGDDGEQQLDDDGNLITETREVKDEFGNPVEVTPEFRVYSQSDVDAILATVSEGQALRDTAGVPTIVTIVTKEERDKNAIRRELAEIQKWFDDNDWKINKRVLAEWTETDIRWSEYTTQRARKRARQDELNALLKTMRS